MGRTTAAGAGRMLHGGPRNNRNRLLNQGAWENRPNLGATMKRYARLTQPMVRDGEALRTATWHEALDRAAAAIGDARARDATRTYGMFSCSKATNEVNYAAQKFSRVVAGSNNIDSCNRT
jgi:formate dehydrogenase (hydrogenase)